MGKKLGQSGFTLLELMIAITVTAVIVTLVGSAMRLGHRAISKGERSMERLERMRVSLRLMDCQIQSLFRSETGEAAGMGEAGEGGFKGDESGLSFFTNYSIWTGRQGCVSVAYRVVTDERGRRSLYAVENRMGATDEDAANETLMLDGMESIYFEYPADEDEWAGAWEGGGIPEKIRVNLIDGQNELHLIVPVRAGGA